MQTSLHCFTSRHIPALLFPLSCSLQLGTPASLTVPLPRAVLQEEILYPTGCCCGEEVGAAWSQLGVSLEQQFALWTRCSSLLWVF